MPIEPEPIDSFRHEFFGFPFMLGKNHTEETKKLMRETHPKHWKGKKHTDETKAKMRQSNKKMHCPIHAEAMRTERLGKGNPFYGKKHEGDLKRFGHQKRCKEVTIDSIKYPSSKAAADALGKSKALICKWIKQGKAVVE